MTLKEIGKLAGVSSMTVSNVINNKDSRVSQETKDKIKRILKDNRYVPNLSARSLSMNSSKIIAVMVPITPKSEKNLFQDPYIAQILGILEEKLREKGYFAMIRSVENVDDTCSMLKYWNASGAIFIFPYFDDKIDHILLDNKDLPMVFMDSYSENPLAYTVNIDDKKGTYLSTKYLLELGHKKIAFVGNFKGNPLLTARYMGFCEAIKEYENSSISTLLISEDPNYQGGKAAGLQIANLKDTTAVVATSDICAIGIIEGARLAGLKVPKDLSIVGFDDLPIAVYSTPKLTTINQHIEKKAKLAIDILFDKIQNINSYPKKNLIDIEIVERQSTSYKN